MILPSPSLSVLFSFQYIFSPQAQVLQVRMLPWCVPTVPAVPRLRLGYRLTFANYAGSSPQCRGAVQGHSTVVQLQYRGTVQEQRTRYRGPEIKSQ